MNHGGRLTYKALAVLVLLLFLIPSMPHPLASRVEITQGCTVINENSARNSSMADWTFLVYLDGDYYDLEKYVIKFINDMEFVDSSLKVNIIVQIDDYTMWNGQTKRYSILHDTDPEVFADYKENINMWTLGEQNMGHPQTLIDFVCWAVDNYPAEHYSLSLFNHGKGWHGLCNDETNKDELTVEELTNALKEISHHINGKLNVLIFFACLMGMIEVFYPLKEYVEFSIASEKRLDGEDFSFKKILNKLTNQPSLSSHEFVQNIVDNSYYESDDTRYHIVFGVRMEKMGELTCALDDLSQALLTSLPSSKILKELYSFSRVSTAIPSNPYPNDVYRLAEKILYLVEDYEIKEAAQRVMELIDESVIRPPSGEKDYVNPRINGISICFPPSGKNFDDYVYNGLAFSKDTEWDDFICEFFNKTDYSSVTYKNREHVLIDFFTSFINAPIIRLLCYRFAALG